MKVAVLIDTWFTFVGGGQINTYEISKRLAQKGIKIDIITRNCGKENINLVNHINIIKLGDKSDPADLLPKITFVLRASHTTKKTIFMVRNPKLPEISVISSTIRSKIVRFRSCSLRKLSIFS